MSTHQTDAAGNRDLTLEGNKIKMSLTSPETQEVKVTPQKGTINFPSLAQSSIPNFAAAKIVGPRPPVKYVPDFYYILDRCQHLFTLAKMDKSIKRNEVLNIYSFTLYMAYALMYAYLETVEELNSTDANISDVLTLMRSAGFNSNKLPILVSTWIDALGKYVDPDTKRVFLPSLPSVVTQGGYYNNYFLSADTGHLLPNFRAMFSLIMLFSDPLPVNLPPNNRNRNVKLGSNLNATAPELNGTLIARRNVYRIPGLRRLTAKVTDEQLPPVLLVTLQRAAWPSNLHRFMMLDINVLRYLKESTSDLFLHIDNFVYSNVNPIGNSFCTIPLISIPNPEEVEEAVQANAVLAAGQVPAIPAVEINSGFSFASRVKTRTQIINGNVDYAYQTPLVRIIEDAESIIIGQHAFADPQDAWYGLEHEFQTPVVTIIEAQAYFNKI
jgi:hypothetical protein